MSDELISQHGGKIVAGGVGLAAAALRWLVGREVRRVDRALITHDERLADLEKDAVRKTDMDRIVERLEDNHHTMMGRIDELFTRLK